MTSTERQERITMMKQLATAYQKMKALRKLTAKEAQEYIEVLEELERIQRIEDGFHDIMVFAKNYFVDVPNPHCLLHPDTPSPPFHYELCDALREVAVAKTTSKLVVAAPRSHSKTTIASNVFLLWVIAYQDDLQQPYWMIINAKQDGAREMLDVVKTCIEDNPLFVRDFGQLKGSTWNALEIITANNVKISAHGAGEALRGKRFLNARPNVVIDDLETNESCETPDRIAKNLDFLKRTVEPLGDPNRTKIIFVGTVISHNSVLNTVINKYSDWKSLKYKAIMKFPTNMHLWETWETMYHSRDEGNSPEESSRLARNKAMAFYAENKEAMHEGCECLWPERMNLVTLMEIRAQNRLAFNSEYQNTALDPDTAVFTKIWKYRLEDVNLDELDIYGACDPSIGQSKRSDPSAIITVGRHRKTGVVYVLDVDARRRSPDDTIRDIFRKAQMYNYSAFSIETIAFQQFMKDELVKRSAQSGVYLPITEFKSTVKKEARIAALEPFVTSGLIRILSSQQNLEEQLLYFPRGTQNDDCADVLSQVMELVKKRSSTFMFSKL